MSTSLNLEQKATNAETSEHIRNVQKFLHVVVKELLDRADEHDQSKLQSPEVELFTEYTPKLAGCTYGSEEYKKLLKQLKPALDHHYAKNRHHSEYWKNGIEDMNLVDIIEMFCDWKAATMRHNDGNLNKSVEINADRYKISPQLVKIFENSVDLFD